MKNRTAFWRYLLLFTAVIIGFTITYITNNLVKDFEVEERKKVEIWAKGIQELNTISDKEIDFSFISEVIESNTTIPVILTDSSSHIISFKNIDTVNRGISVVEMRLRKAKSDNEPIVLNLSDNNVNYIYYQTSILLIRLAYFPFIQFAILIIVSIFFYFIYRSIRNNEQNRVWVGMARETAHQLGTPVSSLLAWVELIKLENIPAETVDIFEKDVQRLERITDRFSKIGSDPVLKEENIYLVVKNVVDYLTKRISKSKVKINVVSTDSNAVIMLNNLLFEWVIENICKNAIDAMSGVGIIDIKINSSLQKNVIIDITDNGKGMPSKIVKTIFSPGFTTKARGWGLGLSLTKRIVENHHNGKIYVLKSEIGKGSTFRIELPR